MNKCGLYMFFRKTIKPKQNKTNKQKMCYGNVKIPTLVKESYHQTPLLYTQNADKFKKNSFENCKIRVKYLSYYWLSPVLTSLVQFQEQICKSGSSLAYFMLKYKKVTNFYIKTNQMRYLINKLYHMPEISDCKLSRPPSTTLTPPSIIDTRLLFLDVLTR